jgi:hypothetical protein
LEFGKVQIPIEEKKNNQRKAKKRYINRKPEQQNRTKL